LLCACRNRWCHRDHPGPKSSEKTGPCRVDKLIS
jgi:hypothetical protein